MDMDLIVTGNYPNENKRARLERSSVQSSSFSIQWEKNGVYQMSFTAIDDHKQAYNMLTPSALIMFRGDYYFVNSIAEDHSNGFSTKAVTATHIYSECQWIRKREVNDGVKTYTPNDIMSFVFDNNEYGFNWEVIGDFKGHQIENFGNISGQEALAKIIEVWPDVIVFPTNKTIRIYQHDEFVGSHGTRLGYIYNSSEVKLTYDVSAVTNQVLCIGKAKDKPEGADENAPVEYYFPPFLYKDDDSIQKWTHEKPREIATISDERFTDQDSMKNYAASQLVPTPPLTVEITTTVNDEPIPGDMIHLDIQETKLSTDVELVGYTWYPWDKNTPNQITLNSTAKTIFDYNNNIRNKMYADFQKQNQLLNAGIENTNDALDKLRKKVNNLTPSWNGGSIFIDTSSNNGDLSTDDFNKFKNQGARGIICKLTEGTGYTNDYFNQHKNNATTAGLKFIGAYHLFHGNGVAEANYFLQKLRENNVDQNVLVIADIEDTENSKLTTNKAELTDQLRKFYEVLINAGYGNTCDYASLSWFGNRFDQQGRFNWKASYSNNKPDDCDSWQFTENWNGQHVDASYSYNQFFV